MLGLTPPPGGGDITMLQTIGMLLFLIAGGVVYGFVMSWIYRRRDARGRVERIEEPLRKAA